MLSTKQIGSQQCKALELQKHKGLRAIERESARARAKVKGWKGGLPGKLCKLGDASSMSRKKEKKKKVYVGQW